MARVRHSTSRRMIASSAEDEREPDTHGNTEGNAAPHTTNPEDDMPRIVAQFPSGNDGDPEDEDQSSLSQEAQVSRQLQTEQMQRLTINSELNDVTSDIDQNTVNLTAMVNSSIMKPPVNASSAALSDSVAVRRNTARPTRGKLSKPTRGKLRRPSRAALSSGTAQQEDINADPYVFQDPSSEQSPKRKGGAVDAAPSAKRPTLEPKNAAANQSSSKKEGRPQKAKDKVQRTQKQTNSNEEAAIPEAGRKRASTAINNPEPTRPASHSTRSGIVRVSAPARKGTQAESEDQVGSGDIEPGEDEVDEEPAGKDRVFGQRLPLKNIGDQAQKILQGRYRHLSILGEDITRKCRAAMGTLAEMIPGETEDTPIDSKAFDDTLDDIFKDLQDMVVTPPDQMLLLEKKKRAQDMYVKVSPVLARLVFETLKLYEAEAVREDKDISLSNARKIEIMVRLIIESYQKVRSWKVKPVTEEPVTRTTQDMIIAPLKRVRDDLNKAIRALQNREDEEQKVALARREVELRHQSEEEKRRRQHEQTQRNNIWRELRISRLIVETDPWMRQKLRSPPVLEPEPDLDANNEPFERVDVFNARNGTTRPHPHKKIELGDWRNEELDALVDALREFPHPDPVAKYKRIFKKYCAIGGPLRDFTADEIVDMAACLREQLVFADLRDGVETDEWIRNIPVLKR